MPTMYQAAQGRAYMPMGAAAADRSTSVNGMAAAAASYRAATSSDSRVWQSKPDTGRAPRFDKHTRGQINMASSHTTT